MRLGARMIWAVAAAFPSAALAQTPPDAAALKAIEAAIPARDWYPTGYYDVRIAAEAQIAEAPRARKTIVFDCFEGGGQCYDVIDCTAEGAQFNPDDPALSRYGTTALEISRLRGELARLGYPEAVYAGPLADYERKLLAIDAERSEADVKLAGGFTPPDDQAPPVADDFDDPAAGLDAELAAAIEANRLRLAPGLPRVIVDGGCGAGEGGRRGAADQRLCLQGLHAPPARPMGPFRVQMERVGNRRRAHQTLWSLCLSGEMARRRGAQGHARNRAEYGRNVGDGDVQKDRKLT